MQFHINHEKTKICTFPNMPIKASEGYNLQSIKGFIIHQNKNFVNRMSQKHYLVAPFGTFFELDFKLRTKSITNKRLF